MNKHARQDGVYLEPGELAELARAASAAAATAGLHPRALLLEELARVLEGMVDQPLGCLLLPAAESDAADAARRYLLPGSRQPEHPEHDAVAHGLADAAGCTVSRSAAAFPA